MNRKILALSAIIIIAILAIAVIAIKQKRAAQNPEITKQELLQKFQTLKTQYEEAKAQGVDVSEVERLGLEAKQAYDNKDYRKAGDLLDTAQTALNKAAIPAKTPISPSPITPPAPSSESGPVPIDKTWLTEGAIYETHPYYYPNHSFKEITAEIPALKDLGVKTIYLLPIWVHKNKTPIVNYIYLINDYFKIDPVYGTESDLKELINTAHKYNMRIIFDLVTCCAAEGSVPWNNNMTFRMPLSELNEKAANLGWKLQNVTVDKHNLLYYDCKKGEGGYNNCEFLGEVVGNDVIVYYYPTVIFGPAIDRSNPLAIDYFARAAEYYTKEYGIDGWRLDVPNNHWNPKIISGDRSSLELLKIAKSRMAKYKPDVIYLGELPYLNPSDFAIDEVAEASYGRAVGAYVYARTIQGGGNSEEFTRVMMLENQLAKYGRERAVLLEDHGYKRIAKSAPDLVKPLAALMSTVPGIPMIQAGQEIGAKNEWMWLGNAKPQVDWTNGDYTLRDFYKKVFSIRNSNNALKYGDIKNTWKGGDNTYAYSRSYENETVVVVINFNVKQVESVLNIPFPNGTQLKDELNGETFSVSDSANFKITVPAYGSRILTIKR